VRRRTLRLVEAAFWVTGATLLTGVVCAVPSFLFGSGLVSLKFALFVVGLLQFGLGSFGIQPERPHRDQKRISVEGEEPYEAEVALQRLPPLRGRQLPFTDRVSRNAKLFLTGVAVLAVSAAMEVVLGVGP